MITSLQMNLNRLTEAVSTVFLTESHARFTNIIFIAQYFPVSLLDGSMVAFDIKDASNMPNFYTTRFNLFCPSHKC